MKTLFTLFLSLLTIGTPNLSAGSCYVAQQQAYYQQREVIKEVIQPVYALQYLQIPLYSVAYQPLIYQPQAFSYQPTQQVVQATQPIVTHQTCEQKLSALMTRIDSLELKLTQAQTASQSIGSQQLPQANVPQATGTNSGWQNILVSKCAMCHEQQVAQAKGGNFLMFQGNNVIQFDGTSKAKIASSLALGEMPKTGPKLTDQEFAAIMQWIKGSSANK